MAAGAEFVLKEHSWAHRLEEISAVISAKTEAEDRQRLSAGG
jgi:hypothetical protein